MHAPLLIPVLEEVASNPRAVRFQESRFQDSRFQESRFQESRFQEYWLFFTVSAPVRPVESSVLAKDLVLFLNKYHCKLVDTSKSIEGREELSVKVDLPGGDVEILSD